MPTAPCGQKPVRSALRHTPGGGHACRLRELWAPRGRAPGPAADKETHPGAQPHRGPCADLRGLRWLPEGQTGTVVPLGVDVSEDSNKEGRWVPLRTQLPPAGLTELGGARVRGQPPLCPAMQRAHQPWPGHRVPAQQAALPRNHPGHTLPPALGPPPHPPPQQGATPVWGEDPVAQDAVPAVRGGDVIGAPSPLSARPAPLLPGPRGFLEVLQGGGRTLAWPPAAQAQHPTHQLDALGEGVVLPVLLRKALQDLALAFPTP